MYRAGGGGTKGGLDAGAAPASHFDGGTRMARAAIRPVTTACGGSRRVRITHASPPATEERVVVWVQGYFWGRDSSDRSATVVAGWVAGATGATTGMTGSTTSGCSAAGAWAGTTTGVATA